MCSFGENMEHPRHGYQLSAINAVIIVGCRNESFTDFVKKIEVQTSHFFNEQQNTYF
jgi:hypothetical protein